jgi:hypothetical protein
MCLVLTHLCLVLTHLCLVLTHFTIYPKLSIFSLASHKGSGFRV